MLAEVCAKPGKADELGNTTLPLIAFVRGDPKNLVYFFQEERESPGLLIDLKYGQTRQTSKLTTTCHT